MFEWVRVQILVKLDRFPVTQDLTVSELGWHFGVVVVVVKVKVVVKVGEAHVLFTAFCIIIKAKLEP